jgi:hypothetical protein
MAGETHGLFNVSIEEKEETLRRVKGFARENEGA